jgi:hypothetical protein
MTSQGPRTVALAPIRQTATAASAMVVVTCAAGVLGAGAAWRRHEVSVDYVAGEPGVGVAALVSADNTSANVGVLWVLACAATGVLFLTWTWRARCNAERLSPLPHRLARGWAVGGWLVPVVNLAVPAAVLEDVWRVSRPGPVAPEVRHARELPKARLVGFWWCSVLACVLAAGWLVVVLERTATVALLADIAEVTTVLAALQIVAAALAIRLVRQVTAWQTTR